MFVGSKNGRFNLQFLAVFRKNIIISQTGVLYFEAGPDGGLLVWDLKQQHGLLIFGGDYRMCYPKVN